MFYLKQEGEQSNTSHVMFCLCQRTVWFLNVDDVQLQRGEERVTFSISLDTLN